MEDRRPWYVKLTIGQRVRRKPWGDVPVEYGNVLICGQLENWWIVNWDNGGRTCLPYEELETVDDRGGGEWTQRSKHLTAL